MVIGRVEGHGISGSGYLDFISSTSFSRPIFNMIPHLYGGENANPQTTRGGEFPNIAQVVACHSRSTLGCDRSALNDGVYDVTKIL
jgi:hypothetical protein